MGRGQRIDRDLRALAEGNSHCSFKVLSELSKTRLIKSVYEELLSGNFLLRCQEEKMDYFSERSILTPKNEDVDALNEAILKSSILDDENQSEVLYYGIDLMETEGVHQAIPLEFLNSLTPSGMPLQRTILKTGAPVMLLRNLFSKLGLFNGTQLVVLKLGSRLVECRVMSGKSKGKIVFIPRITLEVSEGTTSPFPFSRR